MNRADLNWLKDIRDRTDHPIASGYPGVSVKLVPAKIAQSLGGLIGSFMPPNPVHDERWVITGRGRAALKTESKGD